jgi:hypothetical protein
LRRFRYRRQGSLGYRFDAINESLALMPAGEVARGGIVFDGPKVRLDRIGAFPL